MTQLIKNPIAYSYSMQIFSICFHNYSSKHLHIPWIYIHMNLIITKHRWGDRIHFSQNWSLITQLIKFFVCLSRRVTNQWSWLYAFKGVKRVEIHYPDTIINIRLCNRD